MNRMLPAVLFTAEVAAIGLLATALAFLPVHNTAVAISTGVTAALLANALLPCPCHHHKRGRR
jgi:hypothetical protein